MTRKLTIATFTACLAVAWSADDASARGFGGGGGFRGGGYGGGMHYGGGSFSRTPSFSSFDRGGAGYRGGSYTTNRGGTINYGAAGEGFRGPYGGGAGRGVAGVNVNTAGGRSFTDVGRAGGAVGPYGRGFTEHSNVGMASGPRGVVAGGSRGASAFGPGGVAHVGERGRVGYGPGGAYAGRSYGVSAFRPYGYNAFGGYHSGWVHGYWNGHGYGGWGWNHPYWGGWGLGLGLGLGAGLGWGLSSWGFGSALYGMGYMPYYNPYYVAAPVVAGAPGMVAYDYSQPINTMQAPPADAVTDPAMALFDSARAAFAQGDYNQALSLAGTALQSVPNDTALHEFRGLCLFALGQYDDAAQSIYAVLSVGPGWDWTTLISLYPNPDTYTMQLRGLETFCAGNPTAAAPRFVLAYHYLCEGHPDAAADMYRQVLKLMPSDTLSAKMLQQLTPPPQQPAGTVPGAAAAPANLTATGAPPATAVPVVTDTPMPAGATIGGAWTATPTADTSISLNIQPGGPFTWQVTQKGNTQKFSGASTYGDGVLTLAQDNQGPVLVGRVSWKDPSHMTFRIAGDAPESPGLSFSK